ncbi:MAG: CHAD domain-containing protein [Candidatus Dormibacteria bacterium]
MGILRLEAAPHFRHPSFSDLGEDLRSVDEGRKQMASVYWDTIDLRLARWGASLVCSDGEGWRLTLPGVAQGAEGRPPGANGDDAPPRDLLDLLHGYVRGAPIGPVARLRRVRRSTSVQDAAGDELVRVMSDEISVLDGRRVAARYRQIVLDNHREADIAVVHAVLTRLRAAGAGGPDLVDEHVHVLGPVADEPAEVSIPSLGPGATLLEAVQGIVGASAIRLLRHDAGVRLGRDDEAVHQARVATRRLRSDLDTFSAILDPRAVRRLRAELKWLADLLGEVRDAEVMALRFRKQLDDMGATDGRAEPIVAALVARRDDGRSRLLAGMRSARYSRLLDAVVEFAHAPGLRGDGGQAASEVLPGLAAAPWKALARAVEKLPRHPADEQLHRVRIAAKRARYAAEAAAPVIGDAAGRFAEAVAALQGTLGDFNDAVVAGAWLVEIGPHLDGPSAFLAGALSERQRAMGAAAAAGWKREWKEVDRSRLLRWMSGG